MYKKILVPTDGSEAAEKEVEKVGDLLAEDGEIIILSVASELTPHQFQSKEDIDKLNQSFLDEAQFNVDKMKAKFDPNLNVTTKVLVGFPAETIVKVAEEEDVGLIAISSSGKGRVTKFFIGSVAEKVIHSFKKDVLLVHWFKLRTSKDAVGSHIAYYVKEY